MNTLDIIGWQNTGRNIIRIELYQKIVNLPINFFQMWCYEHDHVMAKSHVTSIIWYLSHDLTLKFMWRCTVSDTVWTTVKYQTWYNEISNKILWFLYFIFTMEYHKNKVQYPPSSFIGAENWPANQPSGHGRSEPSMEPWFENTYSSITRYICDWLS